MNAPRCSFHVAVEMVPIARPPQKEGRRARKGFTVTPIAQQDMQQPLVPGELGDVYLARQGFRCPVVGCPCVSQINQSAEIESGVPKCRQCGQPALWFPSNRALALDGAGEFLFTTTLSTSILENRHIPKPFKFIPYAALGTFALGHIDAAHGNYNLPQLHATPIQPAEPAR